MPAEPLKNIRIVVDLTGGLIHDIQHDNPHVKVDLVFITTSTKDLSRDKEEEVQVKGRGTWNGSWIYAVASGTPEQSAATSFDAVFKAADLYVNKE